MKKHNFPIVLSSIIALTVGTQSAHAFGLKQLYTEAWVALSDAFVGTWNAGVDLASEAVEVVCDGAVCAYKAAEKGVNDAIDNTAQFFVDTYNAVDEWGQELGRDIDRGLSDLREGIYEIKADASEFIQNGWRQLGQYYIKISDATTAWVRMKKCTFKYNIEAVGAGMKEIAALPSKRRAELFICLEKQNAWAKMVSKEGYVIGQNIPCFADFGMPHPERLIEGLVKVHNARLEAQRRVCGNTDGATFAKTNQTTPAVPTKPMNPIIGASGILPMIPDGTNCTGEGIAMGFGKNGVCAPMICAQGYTMADKNGEKICVKETVKPVQKPVQKKAGDPCTANNAVSARINSEGNCAATECIDGWELARYDNGNSKGFCIKTQPKAENVVQEPIHIEPLETQVALLKVDPIGAPDITLKMPQPALAVATPESNQVATAEPVVATADATQSRLDKQLAKLDAKKEELIAKEQSKQLLAQQKAQEEELKRQQKELADFQKQQDAIAKAEAKQAATLAKAAEREENKLARQEAREERQEERALAQAERQQEREDRQTERALAQAAKEAARDAEQQERQSLGLTQVEYNNYKKTQERIEQMKIDVERQRQQLNMT